LRNQTFYADANPILVGPRLALRTGLPALKKIPRIVVSTFLM